MLKMFQAGVHVITTSTTDKETVGQEVNNGPKITWLDNGK